MDAMFLPKENNYSFNSVFINGNQIQVEIDASPCRSWLSVKLINSICNIVLCQQFWFNKESPLRVKFVEVNSDISMEIHQDYCYEYGSIFSITGLSRDIVSQFVALKKFSRDLHLEARFPLHLISHS